jgi:hypothetical protein
VQAVVDHNSIKFKYYDTKQFLQPSKAATIQTVADAVRNILIENLLTIQGVSKDLHVAYSGGLDSGTLAWLCHSQRIPFTALIDNRFAKYWPNIPFLKKTVELSNFPGETKFTWSSFTADHFYIDFLNNCVGGFYGDLAVLHHKDLYYQSTKIIKDHQLSAEAMYDQATDSNLPKFLTFDQMMLSVLQLHLIPKFRQWFDHFQIADPYRDPRIVELVLGLAPEQLQRQFKTAILQKQILNDINCNCWDFLCEHKNDYSKFEIR